MGESRAAVVAGTFYPNTARDLRLQLEALFRHPLGPGELPQVNLSGARRVVGLICPHAGYIYSGAVAAHAFAALAADGKPEVAVVIGPNHHGLGPRVAVSTATSWRTPLGEVPVDRGLADAVAVALPFEACGEVAHEQEHSLEVQLPFLQFLFGGSVPIVPVVMRDQRLETSHALASAIVGALAGRDAVIIASTDLSHYEPQLVATQLDGQAVDAIVAGDPARLLEAVRHGTSMCGPGPVATALFAGKALGAGSVDLLKYATSGDASGNYRQVVGYAAFAIKK